jgi:hypothetical protein
MTTGTLSPGGIAAKVDGQRVRHLHTDHPSLLAVCRVIVCLLLANLDTKVGSDPRFVKSDVRRNGGPLDFVHIDL